MAIVYDHTFTGAHTVTGDPSTYYELTGVPLDTLPAGTLRMRVNADAHRISGSGPRLIVAQMGLAGAGDDTHGGTIYASLQKNLISTGAIANYDLLDLDNVTQYIDFENPLVGASVYMNTPFLFFGGGGADVEFDNVHVTLETVPPPPTVEITTPGGLLRSDRPLNFSFTAAAGLDTLTAEVTDTGGTDTVYDETGFVSPYTGTETAITDGFDVEIDAPAGGWAEGTITLDVEVVDVEAETATDSRSWTAEDELGGGGGGAGAASIADNTVPHQAFYYLKITGIDRYFFAIHDPTDSKYGDYAWTLPTGYSSVKGMDAPDSQFDQAFKDIIGGIATAERARLRVMDFDVTDSNGTHSFFGRLLSPGRVLTNASAIVGVLQEDLASDNVSGDIFVRGTAGAFSAQDTYIGGETIGISAVTGPDGDGVYTLEIDERNKFPCKDGYPPNPNYIVPKDENDDVLPGQTVIATQGAPISFINRTAALYIGHMLANDMPAPESESICRLVGRIKSVRYGQGGEAAKFEFEVESIMADLLEAKVAPYLAKAELAPRLYLGPEFWRYIDVELAVTDENNVTVRGAFSYAIDDGGSNVYVKAQDVRAALDIAFQADPFVLDFGSYNQTFTPRVMIIFDGGASRFSLQVHQAADDAHVYQVSAQFYGTMLFAMGWDGGSGVSVVGVNIGTDAFSVGVAAPRAAPKFVVPLGIEDQTFDLTFTNTAPSMGLRFFTDPGDGSEALARYGDGTFATVVDGISGTVTVKSPTFAQIACYYVEDGEDVPTIEQVVRLPLAGQSIQTAMGQLLASTGTGVVDLDVFPPGVGLGLGGLMDTVSFDVASIDDAPAQFDIDATTKFGEVFTGYAKEQALFLVWDPRTETICARSLVLPTSGGASDFVLSESNRPKTTDRSRTDVDSSNIRTTWTFRYGWDYRSRKFLAPEININDDFALATSQQAVRTEVVEDRTIPIDAGSFAASRLGAIVARSSHTRAPWARITRTVNKTGLLLSPGTYHQVIDSTIYNPFTGNLGVTDEDGVYAWLVGVKSVLETGKVDVTFLIDQSNDSASVRVYSPTALLDFSAGSNGYNNGTGVVTLVRFYTQDAAQYDGIDFEVGDKVYLVPYDNPTGTEAYRKAGTVSAVSADGQTVTITSGLGAVSTTVETIMILQDWADATTSRKTGANTVTFQGDGNALLIDGTARLHRWG